MSYQKCLQRLKPTIEGLPEQDIPTAIHRIMRLCRDQALPTNAK